VQGEFRRAEALCQESLALFSELHDTRGTASVLERLGWIALWLGDAPLATTLLEESVALSRAAGDKLRLAYALLPLALTIHTHTGHSDPPRVSSLLEESLRLFRQEHDQAGMTMGLSMALHEASVLDPRFGDYVNHDFAEYHIATNADVGTIDVSWIEEDDPHVNPMGAKGIGEIGIVGTAAAIANAVYHATGIRVRDLPITLDKLLP